MKPFTWRSAASAACVLLLLSCGDSTGPDYRAIHKVIVTADPSPRFFMNESLQLHASFEDAEGRPVPGPPATWRSENSDYLRVSASGVVTAIEPVGMRIYATANGRTGELFVEAFSPIAPRQPSSFHARAVSNTEIQTAWARGARGLVDSFQIEREVVGAPPGAQPSGTSSFLNLATIPDTAYGDFAVTPHQTYRYRVRACNRYGCSEYSPTVSVTTFPTLLIETSELPIGYLGEAYSAALEANGDTGDVTWSLAAGTLPPGLTIYGAKLLGEPTKAGKFEFTIRAAGAGQTVERKLTIEISDAALPPTVTTASLPQGILGQNYQIRLQASRGDRNYSWAISGGALPAGITLAANGDISGIPSSTGSFAFTVEVTSAGMSGTAALVLDVGYPPVAIDMSLLRAGKLGQPYSEALQARGGDGVNFAWSVVSGNLPPGLTLGSTSGVISGTPTAAGYFPFTVEVASGGRTGRQAFLINTYEFEPLYLENWYLPVAIQGRPYSTGIAAFGGEGSDYEFRLIEGSLPPFLSLDSRSGVISGTTMGAPGVFFFTIEVQRGTQKVSRTYSLTVSSVGLSGFNIAVVNVSPRIPAAKLINALNDALRKWESIIATDLSAFTMPSDLGTNFCQGHGDKLRSGEVIEDFVILVGVYNLDGASGVLGQAGPCGYVTGDPLMFRSGSLLMDESDIPGLTQDQVMAVALHEIGHTLGIGTIWDLLGRDLILDKGGPDPRYTGPAGVAGYKSLGGNNFNIAVENIGGEGTRDGHWRESTFDTELMTGFIEGPGIPMPLSRMTIRSLEDLGYTVNADRADPYAVLYGASAVAADGKPGDESIQLQDDLVIEPYIQVLPGRSLRLERPR